MRRMALTRRERVQMLEMLRRGVVVAMRIGIVLVAVGLASVAVATGSRPSGQATAASSKGGDDRNGAYDAVADWWKPAPDHDAAGPGARCPVSRQTAPTGSSLRSGAIGTTGDERPNGSNYLVVVNRNGDIIERWQQWDSILNKPHQVYISPYDPERHVWVVERGGGRNARCRSSSSRTTARSS